MNELAVNILCRNLDEDRVIPRFSRYLRDGLGWVLTAAPVKNADVYYLSTYLEEGLLAKAERKPVAAYFTHREVEPSGNQKAQQFERLASEVALRVVTAAQYGTQLEKYGRTVQITPPVERERFVPPGGGAKSQIPRPKSQIVAGFSGYTYSNKRKGEDVALALVGSKVGGNVTWRASGRGWPVKTTRYSWADMPAFYQSLDVLVITARVEGVPMPALEALACGVSLVAPYGVGLLDELGEVEGIYRYHIDRMGGLAMAFGEAVKRRGEVDREALRAVTEPYTVENWCYSHQAAFNQAFASQHPAGIVRNGVAEASPIVTRPANIARKGDGAARGTRGIYCVAFGDPARACAQHMMATAKKQLPDVPIALCAAAPIGIEDVFILQPDSDVGARRAKLAAYELAPAEWQSVLYLDADTEVVSPDVRLYFDLIEDGWEFVICKDIQSNEELRNVQAKVGGGEAAETLQVVGTWHVLQFNGGAWSFGRNERVAAFFRRWQMEWEKNAGRDQASLLRAMYSDPLKVYLLGNEWNTFPKFQPGQKTAGLLHWPGRARRWTGQLPRLDSEKAWERVRQFERQQR
jgi:hypothetical protein